MNDERQMTRKGRFLPAGFTLVEMLTVIAIIGIVASLSVPVIKNFGKSNVSVSASRQLLDAVGYARQLAMSQRTTVYMVFVSTNFWLPAVPSGLTFFTTTPGTSGNLTADQEKVATNLLGLQLTGYTYMADGALGDQPGQHQWHYLAPWQSLPDGSFIPMWKFYNAANPGQPFNFNDPVNSAFNFSINAFSYTNTFPFPTQDSPIASSFGISLPYIAFNYLGQLSTYSGQMLTSPNQGQDYDQDFTGGGLDIPLAQGSTIPGIFPNTRTFQVGPAQVIETPPGNSTNISYSVVHIDSLTGRATLEYHKMQ